MSSERGTSAPRSPLEVTPLPPYRIAYLTTPDELAQATAFDTKIFTEVRQQFAGEAVLQPTVDNDEYPRLVANGGQVIGFFDEHNNDLIALCSVALNRDTEAVEPMLQTLSPDTAYMTVAGVDPKYRGQGLGRKMLEMRLEVARQAGKTKALTTVHPTNVASMANLIAAGFLGIARVDSYYLLTTGLDGERIVMFNGDLLDPDWAKKVVDQNHTAECGYTLSSFSDETLGTFMSYLVFTEAAEKGYCIYKVDRGEDKTPVYCWARYIGADIPRSELMTTWESLGSAMLARCGLTVPPTGLNGDFVDWMIYKGVSKLDEQLESPNVDSTLGAASKRLFIEWVAGYRDFIRAAIAIADVDFVFSPSPSEESLRTTYTGELMLRFLLQENFVLRGICKQPDREELIADAIMSAIDAQRKTNPGKESTLQNLPLRRIREALRAATDVYSQQNLQLYKQVQTQRTKG